MPTASETGLSPRHDALDVQAIHLEQLGCDRIRRHRPLYKRSEGSLPNRPNNPSMLCKQASSLLSAFLMLTKTLQVDSLITTSLIVCGEAAGNDRVDGVDIQDLASVTGAGRHGADLTSLFGRFIGLVILPSHLLRALVRLQIPVSGRLVQEFVGIYGFTGSATCVCSVPRRDSSSEVGTKVAGSSG